MRGLIWQAFRYASCVLDIVQELSLTSFNVNIGQGDDLADINNLPQISTVLQELNTYHAMGTPTVRAAC